MPIENCPDCNSVSDGPFASDGKCSACQGTGYVGVLEGFARGMAAQSQACDVCGGSGECQRCAGKGYIDTD